MSDEDKLRKINQLLADFNLRLCSIRRVPALHKASHQDGGGDEINVAGLSGELADDQPPKTHKASHESGGGDAIKLDDLASPDDNTDLDVLTTKHGLCPKAPNDISKFLDGTGSWAGPVFRQNLLVNSGFGVWSGSDANKGISRPIAVDSGSTIPTVGETVTGATSGATGKVIMMTDQAGNWGAGTGTGNLYLGACTGRFQDNENLNGSTSGANFCTVNMPDTTAGCDLVQNGEFEGGTGGWTAGNSAILASVAGGHVGNCLRITEGGVGYPFAYQGNRPVTAGKIYKFSFWVKQGDESTFEFRIYDQDASGYIYQSGEMESGAAWTEYTYVFEAPAGCTKVRVYLFQVCAASAGTFIYFDSVSLYEITPCCTASDTMACDGWEKYSGGTIDVYREHNGSNTKNGSFYSLKIVPSAAYQYAILFPKGYYWLNEHLKLYSSRTITFGCWVKTSTASHCRIGIRDGVASNEVSSYHSGGGTFEWLEVTMTMNASNTRALVYVQLSQAAAINGDTIVYISQPMLVFGTVIGEGNYSPKSQEVIRLEKYIASNLLDGLMWQSTTAYTDLNIEADADAMLPKGAKRIVVIVRCNDSGSAGASSWFALRKDSILDFEYVNELRGLANDALHFLGGSVTCNADGDIQYGFGATGAGTFDIPLFRYVGVQVN